MGRADRWAVLLMSYGGPRSLEEVERYYRHILKGRQPSSGMLSSLVKRYEAIGGRSPLPDITFSIARQLETTLRSDPEDTDNFAGVFAAMKHSHPFIGEVVERIAGQVEHIIAVVLAPHYSRMSIGEYLRYTTDGLTKWPRRPRLTFVLSWSTHPGLISLFSKLIAEKMTRFPTPPHVLFTAHSLPERIVEEGDPYPEEVRSTCRAIAATVPIRYWSFAYQSASGPNWLGPDILDALRTLRERNVASVLVAPIGFLSRHLEVLYDIDIESKEEADRLGLPFDRIPMPDDNPSLVSVLHTIVAQARSGVSDGIVLWDEGMETDPTEVVRRHVRREMKSSEGVDRLSSAADGCGDDS